MKDHIDVLVVDDDETGRTIAAAYLRKAGLTVATCAGGVEMWQWLERHRAPVILLDVMMPGEDGFSLAEQLRGRYGLGIAVIMLTGCEGSGDKATGVAVGADDYLTKPINKDLLVSIVGRYVHSGRKTSSPAAAPNETWMERCPSCGGRLDLSLASDFGAVGTCRACGWSSYIVC
ncbi:PleD family two-component system response regulator [Magnetospirillum sp. UT-4]|uniref:response regulator n=1 Tax=Magnetospirillum sp. UT-4 TaxID=2681467 RepID=UPI00137C61B9|nr:response regulator [Magnetospirillum sp. UT-4]CAA7620518.1 Response regulator consisting of a CheY-like receiver domain and a winged-helix DNA-binding domain [Magnetospirillum sp. UT-4]